MKLNVLKQRNVLFDLIIYFKRHVSDESFRELKGKFQSKYGLDEKEENYLDKVIEIDDYLFSNIDINEEKLSEYFKEITNKDNQVSIAEIVFMLYEDMNIDSLDERMEYISNKSKEEKIQIILKYYFLDNLEEESELENKILQIKTEKQFFEFLDESKISIEEKWKLQSIYFRFDEYASEIYKILKKAAIITKRHEDLINTLENEFYEKWKRYFKNIDIDKFLSGFLNFKIEGIETLNVQLSISNCNSITFRGGCDENSAVLSIGLLINEDFNISKYVKGVSNIYNNLKVISDKSKFDILLSIKEEAAYGQELATKFNLSKPTISHHMNALHQASFVKIEKKENKLYYLMDKENVKDFLRKLEDILIN